MAFSISPRSRIKFADVCAGWGTLRTIGETFEGHGFDPAPAGHVAPQQGQRRTLVAEYHAAIDWTDPAANERVLRVYVDFIDDQVRNASVPTGDDLPPDVLTLLRSLQRDGAPVDLQGQLVVSALPISIPIERYDRLAEPRAVIEHLDRISAAIASDPAAVIGSAKELVETACKLILDDYGEEYERRAELMALYKATSKVLKLSRESVPDSAKGSQAAQRVLQNLATSVQALAELRNELGLGHGRTTPSPALARHARLAANSARTVVEFLFDTWHDRKPSSAR